MTYRLFPTYRRLLAAYLLAGALLAAAYRLSLVGGLSRAHVSYAVAVPAALFGVLWVAALVPVAIVAKNYHHRAFGQRLACELARMSTASGGSQTVGMRALSRLRARS